MCQIYPTLQYEQLYWGSGYFVIGVDEVGRGALAGPVVAGAAAAISTKESIQQEILALGIDDSKRVSKKKRESLVPSIKKYCHTGIGVASVEEVNTIGIVGATYIAMERAVSQLCEEVPALQSRIVLLVDGTMKPQISHIPIDQIYTIIKGDQKSILIATASILAKVFRDQLMTEYARKFPLYKWDQNKGYGTLAHRQVIRSQGIARLHRKAFCRSSLDTAFDTSRI